MNAEVRIQVGVQAKRRYNDEPFRPSRSTSSAWIWETDLDTYKTLTPTIAASVYTQVQQDRASGAEAFTHITIRIDNITHPTPAKGVVVLPKAHRDFGITDIEFTSAAVIQKQIEDTVADLRQHSKY